MFNKFINLFSIFKTKYPKIFPSSTYVDDSLIDNDNKNENNKTFIGNRQRSKTEYDFEDYQELLYYEYLRRRKNLSKNNKNNLLRIRSISF
jgi:hypothetical protein